MAKDKNAQNTRKEQLAKGEHLNGLLELRRKGILTRQQFRLLTWDKQLQGSTKGVPQLTLFELEKQGKGKPVLTEKTGQWTRI